MTSWGRSRRVSTGAVLAVVAAAARSGYATRGLAELLVVQGRPEQAVELVRERADGERRRYERATFSARYLDELGLTSTGLLAELLASLGRADEAIEILSRLVNDHDWAAWHVIDRLARTLYAAGYVDEVGAILRFRADRANFGSDTAAELLADLTTSPHPE